MPTQPFDLDWSVAQVQSAYVDLGIFLGAVWLFLYLSVVLHELGHFIVARLAGLSVTEFTVGKGCRFYDATWRGVRVRLRLFPWEGCIVLAPRWASDHRDWRMIACVAAGPAVDLLITAVLWIWFLSNDAPTADSTVGEVLRWCLILQTGLFAARLWPGSMTIDGRKIDNDVKQIWGHLRGTHGVAPLEAAIRRYDQTFSFEQIRDRPGSLVIWQRIHEAQLTIGRGEVRSAVSAMEEVLASPDLQSGERAFVLDELASLVVIHGHREFADRALEWAVELRRLAPDAKTTAGTLGSVLIEAGRVDEGVPLLLPLVEDGNELVDRALASCYLAKAHHLLGRPEEAASWLERAVAIGGFDAVRDRIRAEIARTPPHESISAARVTDHAAPDADLARGAQ